MPAVEGFQGAKDCRRARAQENRLDFRGFPPTGFPPARFTSLWLPSTLCAKEGSAVELRCWALHNDDWVREVDRKLADCSVGNGRCCVVVASDDVVPASSVSVHSEIAGYFNNIVPRI
jgi:hypothetical protein